MARQKKQPVDNAFALFDVIYQDGARTSNRKVPTADIDQFDRENSIRTFIEQQDRKIAEMSGNPRGPIKSITPSA
ncbi:hypothetical protein HUE56_05260 (plasmid) [Azospirillum oryzae]|uniref:Uncharacterized protein n=1 Tax=Azospirillum oryzae TaxID=286727 RepID=A0A6N1AEH1_9PROT|nr:MULTISPECIES: hypothetical protein [Azospirillum]KAA0577639.1 hypothetical protein FZ029_10830 [Azospirillum sp. Sh1]KAA0588585.1 hypothetical protein FZ938_11985 [Azospirillum oryzae]QKS49936.1 hypothetical protein HUE56_05260 [Azospirillum oryzae]GLR82778.1 hypothetical protein GCM10007856_54800 [Azospirillum oryzae]